MLNKVKCSHDGQRFVGQLLQAMERVIVHHVQFACLAVGHGHDVGVDAENGVTGTRRHPQPLSPSATQIQPVPDWNLWSECLNPPEVETQFAARFRLGTAKTILQLKMKPIQR